MVKNLIETIEITTGLDVEAKQLCNQYFEPVHVHKNTVIEEESKSAKHLYFIESGYMRLFYYDDNGDEVTTHFAAPGNFITSFISLINDQPAKENVECITDCGLLKIEKQFLKKIIDQNEAFRSFSLVMFQQAFTASGIRANNLATLNAEQRYTKIIAEQPEIIQNIPIQYIASYLGIKPQSLSRIRKQMIK